MTFYIKYLFDNGKTLVINYAEPIGHSDKILRVSKDGEKWAVVNAETGEFVSDYKYIFSSIKTPFINDYRKYYFEEMGSNEKIFFVTDLNGKCGAFNEEGIESIPCEYDYCKYTSNNLVMVGNVKDDVMLYGAVNYKGEAIIPVKYIKYCFQVESMVDWDVQPIIPSEKGRRILKGNSKWRPILFLILLKDENGNIGAYDTCGKIRIPFCKDRIMDSRGNYLI